MRVTDMRGVDLARWRFDWDLTLALVAAHPDGTILHRYGGRDVRHAGHWLGLESFATFLEAGLERYAQYARDPDPPELGPPLRLEEVPAYQVKDKGECIHCHMVNPALRQEAQAAERWTVDGLWVHPPPARVGLDLDRVDQRRVVEVRPDTPAARAGLRVGDRLRRLGDTHLATATDLMAALHALPAEGGAFPLVVERAGLTLTLAPGWKHGTPREFAWRSSKWELLPAPGFGGPQLEAVELRRIGLPEDTFAFRVQYLVTWNENRRLGQAAARAGLRKDQIVLGTSVERDFDSVAHFHAWWRLTRTFGEEVEIVLWEDGRERTITLPVIE